MMFSSSCTLPSPTSAEAVASLFGWFTGTTAQSDFSSTYMSVVWLTREMLAIEVDTSLPALRVVRVLDRLRQHRGMPVRIVIDNGTEFTSKALDQWAYENKVTLHFITPGRPMEN